MQFNVFSVLAILGSATTALAVNQAIPYGWPTNDCTGNPNTFSSVYSPSTVGCGTTGNAPGAGSAKVVGSGCTTFFYADPYCKTNYFGGNNPVPDSGCYRQVASYSVKC